MCMMQNLDNIGFNNFFFFFYYYKKSCILLNNSIHLLKADWASFVKLSAFNNTIDLNLIFSLKFTLDFANNLSSSLINFIPLPCEQLTVITFDFNFF